MQQIILRNHLTGFFVRGEWSVKADSHTLNAFLSGTRQCNSTLLTSASLRSFHERFRDSLEGLMLWAKRH